MSSPHRWRGQYGRSVLLIVNESLSVEQYLACFARANHAVGCYDNVGPIEPLTHKFCCEGSLARVTSADSLVNLDKEFPTFKLCYKLKEGLVDSFLV